MATLHIDRLLEACIKMGGSDLHIVTGRPPVLRISGRLRSLDTKVLESDDTVSVEFRDTGAGFPPEYSKTIFEPFFTTKGSGKGTGLGLAICEDIIEKYNGRITAQNAQTGGSIFTVYLPLPEKGPT